MMNLSLLLVLALIGLAPLESSQECPRLLAQLELPKKVKTSGKQRIAKWQDIDKTLNELAEAAEGTECRFTFDEVFRIEKEEAHFPLTNTVVRVTPEESLADTVVLDEKGSRLGTYAGQVRFERTGGLYARKSYTIFYFQYMREDGKLESAGRGGQLLLDSHLVRWNDVKGKVAVEGGEQAQ